jgi:phage replication O-like protein O
MNQTAEIYNFERPVVKADTDEGFIMLANSINSELGKFGVYRLNGRERALIDCVIDKTFKYKKKVDWISESQISEFMGLSEGSTGNINKIKSSLIKRKILITDGRKIGINTTLSEWVSFENQSKKTTGKSSQIRLSNQSNPTTEQSKTTGKPVKSDYHNRKTIKQKTTNTKDYCANRAKQLPNDFQVTDQMTDWAKGIGVTSNIEFETAQFMDYHQARGTTMKDWGKAWQTWMRNTIKFSKPNSFASRSKAQPENFNARDYGETKVGFDL